MVAGWMFYVVTVSVLFLGAGLLLEEACRRVGLAQRWIWAGTMTGSGLVPLLGRFRPHGTGVGAAEPLTLEGIATLPAAGSLPGSPTLWSNLLASLPRLDPLLLGLWGGTSMLLLLLGLFSAVRLRREMRRWKAGSPEMPGVLVSESTGPAAVGLIRGVIVLPRWAVSCDRELRRLMLAHEEEHLRARDPALLLTAAALVTLLPWNLPLWWQLQRLRLAVEVDCDFRVLRRGSDLRSYATLLMEVGRRRAGLHLALPGFAEPTSFLERRIRLMTRGRHGRGWILAMALAAVSVGLIAGACALDQPTETAQAEAGAERTAGAPADPEGPVDVYGHAGGEDSTPTFQLPPPPPLAEGEELPSSPQPAVTIRERSPARATGTLSAQPAFTPREVEPELRNRREFGRALERAYPALLKEAGIGGRVLLWVFVDETGRVANVQLQESSGYEQLDAAAVSTMRTAEFSPAHNRGSAVPVWIALPVTFRTLEQ